MGDGNLCMIGGVDQLAGNKFGLGRRFEDGFQLLGPTVAFYGWLICITPLLSLGLEHTIVRFTGSFILIRGCWVVCWLLIWAAISFVKNWHRIRQSAGTVGLSWEQPLDAPLLLRSLLEWGCWENGKNHCLPKGFLQAYACFQLGILTGGLMCGVSLGKLLLQSIPVLILAVLLVFGISRFPDGMIHGFRVFATVIRSAGTIGIALGAFSYMTGLQLLPGLTPLDEALKVVSSIGIVLLGSLPFAEILQRLLKNPLEWIGEKIGLGRNGTAGLLVGIVSALPVIADMKRMNEREIVMNAALLVCGTSMVAAHLGFVLGVDAPATGALLAGKLTGGIAGVWMAWRIMK